MKMKLLISISTASFIISIALVMFNVLLPASKRLYKGKIVRKRFSEDASDINWEKIFNFLPLGDHPCDMMYGQVKLEDLYPRELRQPLDAFQGHLKEVLRTYGLDLDRIAGDSAMYQEQYITMWTLGTRSQNFVKTICETGFYVGHSSLIWLISNPHAKVYSFDLGKYNYTKEMAKYMKDLFPARMDVIWGDSVYSLPSFRDSFPEVTCDLIFIDGGHFKEEAYSDWFNFRHMAHKNALIILDNYPDTSFDGLGTFWEDAKHGGEIIEIFRCHYSQKPQGFSVGRLNLENS